MRLAGVIGYANYTLRLLVENPVLVGIPVSYRPRLQDKIGLRKKVILGRRRLFTESEAQEGNNFCIEPCGYSVIPGFMTRFVLHM